MENLERTVEEAQDAFWAVIAQKYPDAKTGDFDPQATLAFDEACLEAVKTWLGSNHPAFQEQPFNLAEVPQKFPHLGRD